MLTAENIINPATAYSSSLKLPAAGARNSNTGGLYVLGSYGCYWSGTPRNANALYPYFYSIGNSIGLNPASDGYRTMGLSVRCIKTGCLDVWTPKESNRTWQGITMSSDGTKQTAVALYDKIYASSDSGNTWTPKDSDREWVGVAMSSDGTKQTAVTRNGDSAKGNSRIYISTDSGNSWTAKGPTAGWSGVAMSSDGTKQVAIGWVNSSLADSIYVSTDSGNTWNIKSSNNASLRNVAMSSDGTKITVTSDGYYHGIYISTDSGNTWTRKESAHYWWAIAMSPDGSKQTAAAESNAVDTSGGGIYVSTDFGSTWTRKTTINIWAVDMSSDGSKQTAVARSNGKIYFSTDSGNTWTLKQLTGDWDGIAMSSDGTKQTAITWGDKIYITSDSSGCH